MVRYCLLADVVVVVAIFLLKLYTSKLNGAAENEWSSSFSHTMRTISQNPKHHHPMQMNSWAFTRFFFNEIYFYGQIHLLPGKTSHFLVHRQHRERSLEYGYE